MNVRNRLGIVRLSAAACALALAGGCAAVKEGMQSIPGGGWAAAQVAGLDVEVGPPMIISMSDRPMPHGAYGFPEVRRLPDGTLAIFFSTEGDTGNINIQPNRPPTTQDEYGNVFCSGSPAVSTDGGKTWESRLPEYFSDRVPEELSLYRRFNSNQFAPVLFDGWTTTRVGSVYAFDRKVLMLTHEFRKHHKVEGVGIGKRIAPDGTVEYFESRFRIPDFDKTLGGGEALRIMWRGFEMEDGSLLLVANPKGTIVPYKYECNCDGDVSQLYRSVDAGRNFEHYATIATPRNAPPGSVDGATEPCVVGLPDGSYLAAMRTGGLGAGTNIKDSMPLMFARSDAERKVWKTSLGRLRGVQPRMLVLQNGVLVLSSGRPGTYVSFSLDNGESWVRTTYVVPQQQATSSYTDMIEIEPNTFLLVYDIREFSPPGAKLLHSSQGYNAVLARIITVKRN